MCDNSGLIFRQASNIPECYQTNGTELSDTIYYNIKINEFTPYKNGYGLCATGMANIDCIYLIYESISGNLLYTTLNLAIIL